MGIFIGILFLFLDIFIIIMNILYNNGLADFNMPMHISPRFVNQIFIYWFIILLCEGIFFIVNTTPKSSHAKALFIFIYGFIIIFDTLLKVMLLWDLYANPAFHFGLLLILLISCLLGSLIMLKLNFARIIVLFFNFISLFQILEIRLKPELAFSEIVNSANAVLFAFGSIWFLTRNWVKEEFQNIKI